MNEPISATYIGHATTLTRIGATSILTDPHLGRRVLIAKRAVPLVFDPTSLDYLSAVLISHMHYDHMNTASYRFISSGVPVIVPERTEPVVGRLIANPIIELSHWATHELADGTTVTAVPVLHRGGRLSQLRYTASNDYIIQRDNRTIFFCGDSAYGPHFKEIGNVYRIDLAYLPIGSYRPRWFMKSRHMTPEEAVQAFDDLGARHFIPVHWGTFRLSLEGLAEPRTRLEKVVGERPELEGRIHLIEPGASCDIASELDAASANRAPGPRLVKSA